MSYQPLENVCEHQALKSVDIDTLIASLKAHISTNVIEPLDDLRKNVPKTTVKSIVEPYFKELSEVEKKAVVYVALRCRADFFERAEITPEADDVLYTRGKVAEGAATYFLHAGKWTWHTCCEEVLTWRFHPTGYNLSENALELVGWGYLSKSKLSKKCPFRMDVPTSLTVILLPNLILTFYKRLSKGIRINSKPFFDDLIVQRAIKSVWNGHLKFIPERTHCHWHLVQTCTGIPLSQLVAAQMMRPKVQYAIETIAKVVQLVLFTMVLVTGPPTHKIEENVWESLFYLWTLSLWITDLSVWHLNSTAVYFSRQVIRRFIFFMLDFRCQEGFFYFSSVYFGPLITK
ncbi:hypothetical protein HK102_008940 [Quaeritorhiza haematococci]|nr:hypothetical protein HK102_008940 [Quaeritorhiza haematococci]